MMVIQKFIVRAEFHCGERKYGARHNIHHDGYMNQLYFQLKYFTGVNGIHPLNYISLSKQQVKFITSLSALLKVFLSRQSLSQYFTPR